jgi:hypothetical protein
MTEIEKLILSNKKRKDREEEEAEATLAKNSSSVCFSLEKNKNKKKRKGTGKNVKMPNIGKFLGNKPVKNTKDSKEMLNQLSQLLKEHPLDIPEEPHCPDHPDLEMIEQEQPPSMRCPQCGFLFDKLDIMSSQSHTEKDTTNNTTFQYRPWIHFKSSVLHFIDEQKFVVPEKIYDVIYVELANRNVTDLKNVQWYIYFIESIPTFSPQGSSLMRYCIILQRIRTRNMPTIIRKVILLFEC